ncbi:MAG: carbohydrate kinase [Terrimonas sp.]|nr:carbohydrate kinase [Terrimonas sp.]
MPVILIFDIGKTNKKILLFDEAYQLVLEDAAKLEETVDEDGFPCEDISALAAWVLQSFQKIGNDQRYEIRAVNFTAYGASFVYLDDKGAVIPPLYNYLKPYPELLKHQFYDTYGGESQLARETASPVLGSLNSGLQLYRLKYEKPERFARIRFALHLPQYLGYILSGACHADITSIGCHTHLWDFQQHGYHRWVSEEGILEKLAPLRDGRAVAGHTKSGIPVGLGLHDSSAALIPYLVAVEEPFLLLSTGTWNISLNPFNAQPLTQEELENDCLSYLSFLGKPVKASRLFAGYEHEQQVRRLSEHFLTDHNFYTTILPDNDFLHLLKASIGRDDESHGSRTSITFAARDLSAFENYTTAYHHLMAGILVKQMKATDRVLRGTGVKKIFVDGGFSKNRIFLSGLAAFFPMIEIYTASVQQATALGAALAIHSEWNRGQVPRGLFEWQSFQPG